VRQFLQHEADKLQSSSTSSVKPVDSGLEPMNIENSTTDAVAAAAETSTQPSNVSGGDSAAVSNPCIAVTRSAPQQYYKEVTTYGEMLSNLQKFIQYCIEMLKSFFSSVVTVTETGTETAVSTRNRTETAVFCSLK